MEILELYIQTLLDTVSIFLISIKFSNRKIKTNKNNLLWIFLFHLTIFITRLDISQNNLKTYIDISFTGYDILPVRSILGVILLVLFSLIINSMIFRLNNKETIFSVIVTFIIWIVIRVTILALLNIFNLNTLSVYSYLYRMLTFICSFIIYFILPLDVLKYHVKEKDIFTKVLFIYSFLILVFLIGYSNFDIDLLLKNPVTLLIIFLSIILINLWVMYVTRENFKQEKRVEIAEQYLPIINELVVDIQGKQHEFNNKLLGILSIIETSNDLETLKSKVRKYTDSSKIENNIMEILDLEDRILSGFLYYKVKTANFKGIELNPVVKGHIHNSKLEDYEIIEILGILIDNAIEASNPGENIKVIIESIDNILEIRVINAFKYISNEDFLNMFQLNYSTKSQHLNIRGFGLYNLKKIANKYKGKIITKNNNIDGKNYITIGVIIN